MSATEVSTEMNVDVTTEPDQSQKVDTPEVVRKARGRPKSGRSWKIPEQRASSTIAVKPLHKKWAEKQEQRQKDKQKKAIVAQLIKEQGEESKKERERIQARRKQREENTIKSSQYQIVKHTAKIKRMSKKQRRNLMKLSDLKNVK